MFALLAGVATEAQAQVGVRLGANYTGFSGSNSNDLSRAWGYHGGLFYSIPVVEDFFAVQPEVLYSRKGASVGPQDYRIPYIDIPVLAKINAGPLYFEAGPQASFRVGGVITTDGAPDITIDTDRIQRTTIGYAAGIGFNATQAVNIGVRYNGYFTDDVTDNSANFRQNIFMFTLGFMFSGR
ncbi:PorT family protein [Pontibacter sp. SGAir0037]|nr:PorT family protein [Pontibacter sp. SGAir0037]